MLAGGLVAIALWCLPGRNVATVPREVGSLPESQVSLPSEAVISKPRLAALYGTDQHQQRQFTSRLAELDRSALAPT